MGVLVDKQWSVVRAINTTRVTWIYLVWTSQLVVSSRHEACRVLEANMIGLSMGRSIAYNDYAVEPFVGETGLLNSILPSLGLCTKHKSPQEFVDGL